MNQQRSALSGDTKNDGYNSNNNSGQSREIRTEESLTEDRDASIMKFRRLRILTSVYEYTWDTFPAYRMDVFLFEVFLRRKFGNYDFHIRAGGHYYSEVNLYANFIISLRSTCLCFGFQDH